MTKAKTQPAKKKAAPKKAAVKKKPATPSRKATTSTNSSGEIVDALYKAIQTMPNGNQVKKEDFPANLTDNDALVALNALVGSLAKHPLGSKEWKEDFKAVITGPLKNLFGEKVLNTVSPDTMAKINGQPQPKRIELIELSLKDLPGHVLANFRNEIDSEFGRRSELHKDKAAGEEGAGSDTNIKGAEQKQPAMYSELQGLDFQMNVLYGTVQRLNRLVTRAGGETFEIPPSMAELTEKEKPSNMLAAAKLLNHKANLLNNALNEHLNEMDRLV